MGVLQASAGLLSHAGAMGLSAIQSLTGSSATSATRSDRLVSYLTTLATYPNMFLQLQAASAAEGLRAAGDAAAARQLQDLPEGRALLTLEIWCRLEPFTSLQQQLLVTCLQWLRQQLLTNAQQPRLQKLCNHPRVLQLLHVPPPTSITSALRGAEQRAVRRLQQSQTASLPQQVLAPVVLVDEVQEAVAGPVSHIKVTLETPYSLQRGNTLLEHAQIFVTTARWLTSMWFGLLRASARALAYGANIAGVMGTALTFTVVAAVVLSVFSTILGLMQVGIMAFVDFTEPLVLQLLVWCEAGTNKAVDLGEGSLIGPQSLPPSTVEQLEPFFLQQLASTTTILSRPEIPQLHDQPLLVKAYDCGLLDATGRVRSETWLRRLEGRGGGVGPFRPDGFFGYASQRTVRAGIVLLCRLLSWQRLLSLVARHEALSFVVIAGGSQAGKSTLFSRLVGAPEHYAALLGGTSSAAAAAAGGNGTADGGAVPAARAGEAAAGGGGAAAVDIWGVKGLSNCYAVVFPGMQSMDRVVADVSCKLAVKVTGLASCVVYLVVPHPEAPVTPQDLRFVVQAAAAGRPVLVAINGPPRPARRLLHSHTAPSPTLGAAGCGGEGAGGSFGGRGAIAAAAAAGGGAGAQQQRRLSPQLQSGVLQAWRAALDSVCAAEGVDGGLVALMATDILQDRSFADGSGMGGVHGYDEVRDWVWRSVANFQRTA